MNRPSGLSDTVVLDLETKRLAREVGGWVPERMGLAVAVTWDEENGFREWFEKDTEALVLELSDFKRVVGFNVLRFDYRVLATYHPNVSQLLTAKTVDILADVYEALGFRISLDNMARATLGRVKTGTGDQAVTGTGDQAVRWWRQGKRDLVIDYCREDAELTRDIYAYGLSHGVIYYPHYWPRLLPILQSTRWVPVNWSEKSVRRRQRRRTPRHPLSIDINRQPVESSAIRSVGYDPASQTLEIEFHSSGIYQFFDVPEAVYEDLMQASEPASYFNNHIRGRYHRPRKHNVLVAFARLLRGLKSKA